MVIFKVLKTKMVAIYSEIVGYVAVGAIRISCEQVSLRYRRWKPCKLLNNHIVPMQHNETKEDPLDDDGFPEKTIRNRVRDVEASHAGMLPMKEIAERRIKTKNSDETQQSVARQAVHVRHATIATAA